MSKQKRKHFQGAAPAIIFLIALASLLIFSSGIQAADKTVKKDTGTTLAAGTEKENSPSALDGENLALHGNVKSKVFHREGCRNYNCGKCTAVFKNREQAMNSGYKACKACKP